MKKIQYFYKSVGVVIIALFPSVASAHCPLCTAATGALAIIAISLGVSTIVVGLFVGSFALAMGVWFSRLIKKKYIRFQDPLVSLIVFLATVLPIMPLIVDYRPLYVSIYGKYGTLLNNTYVINLYLMGASLGFILLLISPFLSKLFSKIIGKKFPFQNMAVTILLLTLVGLLLQLLLT